MSNFSDRLKIAINSAGITQKELARIVGVSQQTIGYLCKDGKGSTHTHSLAEALGVNAQWLAKGRGPMRADEVKWEVREAEVPYAATSGELDQSPSKGKIPLISSVQAGEFRDTNDDGWPGEPEDWVSCHLEHSDHTYALRIDGISMEPRFKEGEIIVVDPEKPAVSGSFVVAKRAGDERVTFKQLMKDGGESYLRALNPDWPKRIIRIDEEWQICGVAIMKSEILP